LAFLILVSMISIFPVTAAAQPSDASIAGTVVVSDGSALPGVVVTVRCKCSTKCPGDSNCSCCPAAKYVTDAGGKFHFRALSAGEYEVRAEFDGYQPVSITVSVAAGSARDVTIEMKPEGAIVVTTRILN
jgi:iron complex outermembrane receptor protein